MVERVDGIRRLLSRVAQRYGPDPGLVPVAIHSSLCGSVASVKFEPACLFLTAIALVCNYLAVYLLLAASVPAFYLVVILEERELRDRFGEQYEQYCLRVPRFVPRFGTRSE